MMYNTQLTYESLILNYKHKDFEMATIYRLKPHSFSSTAHLPPVFCILYSVFPLQINLFMQNKPNFHKAHNELNSIPEKELRKIFAPSNGEKQTQTNPIQSQFPKTPK